VTVSLGTTSPQKVFGGSTTLTLSGKIENLVGTSFADRLTGSSGDNVIYGGDGDDTIYCGSGNDLVLGGAGDDTIYGNNGRNVLIGGVGRDTLKGAGNDDLLIGGTTLYDENLDDLLAILSQWSSKAKASERVANLTAGIAGASGMVNLERGNGVIDDETADSLYGGAGSDWYLSFDSDILRDQPGKSDFT